MAAIEMKNVVERYGDGFLAVNDSPSTSRSRGSSSGSSSRPCRATGNRPSWG